MDFKMTAISLQLVIPTPAWFLVLKGSVKKTSLLFWLYY